MSPKKHEIITFKVDESMAKAMEGIPNRSEFIRTAILGALEGVCPLCGGSGTLTHDQRKHWMEFASTHALRKCTDCDAMHLVCQAQPGT